MQSTGIASQVATIRPRVLIIEDEESMRLLLAAMVSAELKAEVQLADTCEQALRLAKNQPYDAILLDLMMPGIGGFGVLQRVRGSGPNDATPVLMISADEEAAERCLAAGATAYLVKPVKAAELGKVIKQHIAARSRKP